MKSSVSLNSTISWRYIFIIICRLSAQQSEALGSEGLCYARYVRHTWGGSIATINSLEAKFLGLCLNQGHTRWSAMQKTSGMPPASSRVCFCQSSVQLLLAEVRLHSGTALSGGKRGQTGHCFVAWLSLVAFAFISCVSLEIVTCSHTLLCSLVVSQLWTWVVRICLNSSQKVVSKGIIKWGCMSGISLGWGAMKCEIEVFLMWKQPHLLWVVQ